MRFTILIVSLLVLHSTSADLLDDTFDTTKGLIRSVSHIFTKSYRNSEDLLTTGMEDLRSKVDSTVSYLGNAYENRESIVKKGGKKVGAQMDKLRPAYDEALALKNKLSRASADQYEHLSKEWSTTISKLEQHGFDDFVDMTKEHSMPIIGFLAATLCVMTVALYVKN